MGGEVITQVLVVGAGPAGISAATAAAENGRSVTLLDDNFAPGGQIWRPGTTAAGPGVHASKSPAREKAIGRMMRAGVRVLPGWRVFDAPVPGMLAAVHEDASGARTGHFHYEQLILATGARERFLPFAGWTLPGVFGAGGLQALVRGGYPVRGKRVVVAGTGPLLLAVAAHLRQAGARVSLVAEQAPLGSLVRFGVSLLTHPGKLLQGVAYRAPLRAGCWVTQALPCEQGVALRAVRLTDGARTWEEPCDLLASGFHLVGNTELAELLGCQLQDGRVVADSTQRTTVENIWCAGEPTGVAGLEAAVLQGRIAGLTCAGKPARQLVKKAAAERRLAARMDHAFALRKELRELPREDTLICRCEDVSWASLRDRANWTDAKLQTRCGMGPCQGRVCGPAVEFLLGWKPASIRPPLSPVPLSCFIPQAIEEKA